MALFKKKEKPKMEQPPKLPDIPQLPELPEFKMGEEGSLSQLPSFPTDSLGNKFSQNTIKEAVAGKKENKEVGADEFAEEKVQMMQKPLVKEERGNNQSYPKVSSQKEEGPIFIRIDKFEEGSKTFEDVRRQITDIEGMFEDIKGVREKEGKELESWEEEIKQIKEKIESIDNNIFSKLE